MSMYSTLAAMNAHRAAIAAYEALSYEERLERGDGVFDAAWDAQLAIEPEENFKTGAVYAGVPCTPHQSDEEEHT